MMPLQEQPWNPSCSLFLYLRGIVQYLQERLRRALHLLISQKVPSLSPSNLHASYYLKAKIVGAISLATPRPQNQVPDP